MKFGYLGPREFLWRVRDCSGNTEVGKKSIGSLTVRISSQVSVLVSSDPSFWYIQRLRISMASSTLERCITPQSGIIVWSNPRERYRQVKPSFFDGIYFYFIRGRSLTLTDLTRGFIDWRLQVFSCCLPRYLHPSLIAQHIDAYDENGLPRPLGDVVDEERLTAWPRSMNQTYHELRPTKFSEARKDWFPVDWRNLE